MQFFKVLKWFFQFFWSHLKGLRHSHNVPKNIAWFDPWPRHLFAGSLFTLLCWSSHIGRMTQTVWAVDVDSCRLPKNFVWFDPWSRNLFARSLCTLYSVVRATVGERLKPFELSWLIRAVCRRILLGLTPDRTTSSLKVFAHFIPTFEPLWGNDSTWTSCLRWFALSAEEFRLVRPPIAPSAGDPNRRRYQARSRKHE